MKRLSHGFKEVRAMQKCELSSSANSKTRFLTFSHPERFLSIYRCSLTRRRSCGSLEKPLNLLLTILSRDYYYKLLRVLIWCISSCSTSIPTAVASSWRIATTIVATAIITSSRVTSSPSPRCSTSTTPATSHAWQIGAFRYNLDCKSSADASNSTHTAAVKETNLQISAPEHAFIEYQSLRNKVGLREFNICIPA